MVMWEAKLLRRLIHKLVLGGQKHPLIHYQPRGAASWLGGKVADHMHVAMDQILQGCPLDIYIYS